MSTAAAEESIDSLLKKLPPPEKLVKPHVQQALADPALKDPLVARVLAASTIGNSLALGRELAQKNPKSPFAHLMHSATAMDARQWPEAEQAARTSLTLDSNHGITHLMLGVAEIAQHHYAAALGPLQETNRLQPTWATGWMLSSQCAIELGRREEAISFARRGTSIDPDWSYAWLQLGRAEKAAGHPPEMLNAVAHAAALSPNDSEMQAIVGFGYINLNQISRAAAPLRRAAQLAPNDYLIQGQLGYSLEVTGQYGEAVDHFRKSVALNPNYGAGWEQLGLAFQKQGRHPDSIKAYEHATQLMPKSRLSWQHLAQEYRAVGRGPDAARAEERAGGRPQAAVAKNQRQHQH